MPSANKKLPRDPNQRAAAIVAAAIGEVEEVEEPPKNEAAAALSRLGASKGGKARAAKLSAKRRKEIAKKAVKARWEKEKS